MRLNGLTRIARRRVTSDPSVALLAGLLLAVSASLPATGLLYGDRIALAALRSEFVGSVPQERVVRVAMAAPSVEVERLDGAIRGAIGAAIGAASPDGGGTAPFGGDVIVVVRSDGYHLEPTTTTADTQGPDDLVALSTFEAIEDHADLTAGRWPMAGRTPLEASLSVGAAASLGLTVGDEVAVTRATGGSSPLSLRVTGTWQPDATDPYWAADALDLTGSETVRLTTRGPFALTADDLRLALGSEAARVEWRGLPDPDRLTLESAAAMEVAVAALPDRIRAIAGPARGISVTTGLPDRLAQIEQGVGVGRTLIVLLVLELSVVALYALLLIGSVLADRRRAERAVLRERGASTRAIALAALFEGGILAVPAALGAVILAWTMATLLLESVIPDNHAGSILPDAVTVIAAVTAAAIGAVALAGPSMQLGTSGWAARLSVGRRVGRTLGQRLGLDLVLVALAGIAIWQLRTYGSVAANGTAAAGGGRAMDPVLVLTPAIGLLAGAIIATRLLPRLAQAAAGSADRVRGLVVPLGGREISRRSGRHTRVALLVILATALGGLATAQAGTWRQSQADQAAYRSVADVRVVTGTAAGTPGWLAGPAYRSINGVDAATAVLERTIDGGPAAGGQLLALDPAAVAALPDPAASLVAASAALRDLGNDDPGRLGIEIPDGTTRLAVVLDADLRGPGDTPDGSGSDGTGSGIPISGVDARLYFGEADGRITSVDIGRAPANAEGSRLELALARDIDGQTLAPDPGLRLLAVELSPVAPQGVRIVGMIGLRAVEASTASANGATSTWASLPIDPASSGWRWTRFDDNTRSTIAPPGSRPNMIVIGNGAGSTPPAGTGILPTRFRLWAPRDDVVPLAVIANAAFVDRFGAAQGDVVDGQMVGDGVRIRITDRAELFPPLDPARPFMVIDRAAFELARLESGGTPIQTDEWWLTTAPGSATGDLDAILFGPPFRASRVIDRATVLAAGASDPISLGILGALSLGALAAIFFATVGFVVQAAISTRGRLAELALLRALGLSSRQVLAWLWLEHAAVLFFSMISGTILGLVLAWLVVPSATMTQDGTVPVPAPEVVLPVTFMAGLAIGALALLAVTLALLARLAGRVDVAAILREAEA